MSHIKSGDQADRDLEITELYLPEEDPREGWAFPGPKPLPESLSDRAELIASLSRAREETDFTVSVEGVSYRIHRMPTSEGMMLVCRKIPSKAWSLSQCGLPPVIHQALMSDRLNQGGLVLVAGKPGTGKSVTTAAMIKDRLETYSGICITVEDPVEMPLQGSHGGGYCLQRGVVGQEDYAGAVRDAMRAYPTQVNSILMIGEVRDPETAALALRASVDGRLVLTTMHAGNPIQALYRILSLASHSIGAQEARGLLAAGMRIALHQRLQKGRLSVNILMDTQQVASILHNRKASLELLQNEMATQRNKLRLGYDVKLRDIG